MRSAREQRSLSIASIAETTKILGALIEGLEHGDLSRWPTGFYRRAFIRAYATAIGLDQEATVKEFLVCFPDPEATTVASSSPTITSPVVTTNGVVATTGSHRQRCLAVAVDWFVLCVMGLALYAVVGSFWAPLCVAAAVYYASGIILLGNSPGVLLLGVSQTSIKTPEARSLRSTRKRASDRLSALRERFFAVPLLRVLRSIRSSVFSVP